MSTMEAQRLLGELRPAMQRRDRLRINRIIERLIELRAPIGEQWRSMAMLANTHGEAALARRAMELLVETEDTPKARFDHAVFEAQNGRLAEAYRILQSLPPGFPDPANRAHIEGTTALNRGDRKAAVPLLLEATRLHPKAGAPWLSLSLAANLKKSPEIAQRIIDNEPQMSKVPDLDKVAYFYALGKAFLERGENAEAFRAFSIGAAAQKRSGPYDRMKDLAQAREALAGCSREWIEQTGRRVTIDTSRPIFVIGLPRSGTTLLDQILVSHSTVARGAETGRMGHTADLVGGNSARAVDAFLERGGTADFVAAHYIRLIDEYLEGAGRKVDKSLNHSRFLALIAGLLPQAPLIWVRRNPLDCAWSCFRTYFMHGSLWTFNFEDIAYHMQLEDRLFKRWTEMLGERILVVPFEELVDQPDEWIAKILDHCGLEHEEACFKPHLTDRAVTTASVAQVREAINKKGVGAYKPFEGWLGPFKEAYAKNQDFGF